MRLRASFAAVALCVALSVTATSSATTAIFGDDFETGDLSRWMAAVGMTVQAQVTHAGSRAARGVSTGSATYAYRRLAQTENDLTFSTWVDVVSRSAQLSLLGLQTATGKFVVKVFLDKQGHLAYTNVVTKGTTKSGVVVTNGTWHRLSLHAVLGPSGRVEISFDGSPVATLTKTENLGTTGIARVLIGNKETGRTYDVAFDDVVVETSGAADTQDPTVPGTVTATATSSTAVDVGWVASDDDTGIARYVISRDGAPLAEVSGTATAYTDDTVRPNTTYSYTVEAFDAAGNASGPSEAAVVETPDGPPPSERPNVLIFLTDDQREGLEVMPKTLDWFRTGGTEYRNAFITTPLCCPSRASIFTGRYAHNTNVHDNQSPGNLDQTTTMQYALQRAGYHTVLFGKLLNSWGLKDPPYFDTWALYNGSEKSYIDAKWNIQGTVQFIDQYATRFIGDRTVSFLRSPPSSPWFLYLSVPNPHTPYIAEEQYANAAVPPWSGNPAVFESDRTDKPPYVQEHRSGFSRGNETRTAQLRTLMSVDDMVDRVMTTLRDTGQLDNTLIFFLSDNGYLWSDHGLFGKRYPYLPSIQVPMFVRWDGHLASGAVDDRLVANIDIAPTVYDAAGITPPVTADGHSLLSPYARDRLLFEYWVDAGVPTWASLVTTAGQYIETYDDAGNPSFVEFYDLARDPWELENTGVAPAGWAAQLAADRTCAGASCP